MKRKRLSQENFEANCLTGGVWIEPLSTLLSVVRSLTGHCGCITMDASNIGLKSHGTPFLYIQWLTIERRDILEAILILEVATIAWKWENLGWVLQCFAKLGRRLRWAGLAPVTLGWRRLWKKKRGATGGRSPSGLGGRAARGVVRPARGWAQPLAIVRGATRLVSGWAGRARAMGKPLIRQERRGAS